MRQQPAIVQRRTPAHQLAAIGLLPEARHERAQQQHLHRAHARVRRHLEGAEFDQAQAAGRAVGRIELVDRELGPVRIAGKVGEQVAQQAVDQPGLRRLVAGAVSALELLERDVEFVESIVARLVDARRLAGRADEDAGEQVRQRRMVLPVGDQALQQVGAAQQRAVGRRGPAEGHVVATAGAGVAAVEHELLGAEPRLPRLLVQRRRGGDQFTP